MNPISTFDSISFRGWLLGALVLLGSVIEVRSAQIYPRPSLEVSLDVDADGLKDAELRSGNISACLYPLPVGGFGLYGLAGAEFLTVGGDCIPDLRSVPAGTAIGPGVHSEFLWMSGGEAFSSVAIPGGETSTWGPMVDLRKMYVGVRVPTPSGYRYGWIELGSPSLGEVATVLGYAVEGRVETSVAAGQLLPPPPLTSDVAIRVGADQRVIGGIRSNRTTHPDIGTETLEIDLVHPPTVQVLTRVREAKREPVLLGSGTFVPSPLPADWGWQAGGNSTLALRRTERSSTGGLISDAGPLASDSPGQAALRSADGTVWWIPLDGTGRVGAIGRTVPSAPRLLAGQPMEPPGVPSGYLDLDRDGLVDFVVSQQIETFTPPGGNPQVPGTHRSHWLIPMPGNRVLTPTTLPIRGGTISGTPPAGGGWSANGIKLLVVTTTPDSFFGSFSAIGELRLLAGEDGYVGVEFQTGAGRRFGWIRFNQHSLFTGRVSAGRGIYVHYLDLVDFGCGTGPEAEAVVGANSTFPLGLGVALESGNLRVTWDLTAGAGRLESSRSIPGDVWVQEPTGAFPSLLLPILPDGQPQYFRLRLPQVFPATH
jgi:hypothetical protein